MKLELQLFNNAKAKVDNAVSQDDIKDDKALVDAAKNLARRAVAPILEKNSGQLFVNVTAAGADGATIDIDDKTAGITTPPGVQPAPIPLGWGPHHVRVKKEGFLTFEKDIQIDEGQSTTLVVTLIPSPDFIDAYKSRNSKLRIGAYATGIIAIAAAGFAVEQEATRTHASTAPLRRVPALVCVGEVRRRDQRHHQRHQLHLGPDLDVLLEREEALLVHADVVRAPAERDGCDLDAGRGADARRIFIEVSMVRAVGARPPLRPFFSEFFSRIGATARRARFLAASTSALVVLLDVVGARWRRCVDLGFSC